MASIYRVVDRAVADPLVVHHFHNLGDGTYILLCFTVQLYICDMSTARNGVERSFTLDFLNDADRFFHIYVERVDIIVAVCHSGDFSIFPTIHFSEASRKSFGRCCIVLFALTGCTNSGSTIRFGAADIGGMYYSFANTFTELANEQGYDFTCRVRTTAGSNANIRLLSDDYIEIGIAQADLIADAYKTNEDLRAIAGLYTETCQLVVRADSNIQTLDDLSGHTVSIGAEESGTERNATQILEFAGMPSSLVATKNLDYIEATKELKAGDIDAFFCTAGLTTTVIDELSKECDIRLIPLTDTVISKMLESSSAYTSEVIPAGTYTGQTTDISTIGVKSVLITKSDVSDDTIEQLTSLLFEKENELSYSNSLKLELTYDFATDGIPIPFHNGAKRYYEACGYSTN